MSSTTLMTKVMLPRRRDDVLTRQRLLNALYDMVDYRLALVSAPAGYGKSTLLVDFAADLEHPVCWYALDASDHDPRTFLERLVMALQHRFHAFGAETLRALAASADLRGGAPGVVRVLVNEIVAEIPRWFVLVLDDYHALGKSTDVDSIISNFVAYQRDQCLTIIASRTVPNLPLIIPLVARGGVGGIGPDEMRFLPDEIQALFAHNYGTDLTMDEANKLAEQSEGWVTGLLLTAYTQRQGVLQSWMRARNSHQPVYDYLTQEVLDRQPPEMQRFLCVSSTLTEMNEQLCREVLEIDDALDMLGAIEAGNLFVTRFEEDWYRYHHLFREFLQNHLRRQDSREWRLLHVRAARWFERHDQPREAVAHYLAVGAQESAARLMGQIAYDLYVAGRLTTLMTWREQLPDEALIAEPRLALYQSRAAYKLGQQDVALALTDLAEHGYREINDVQGLAYTLLHRCQVWMSQGKAEEVLELATSTLALIEEAGVHVRHEAHRIIGLAEADLGDLAHGNEHLHRAVVLSDAHGDAYASALARTGLAHCLSLQGDLVAAVALNYEAVETWRRLGSDAALADELNDLGFHLYALGDYDEAMRCLQEALALSRRTGLRQAEAVSLIDLGEMTRDLGLLDQAIHYLEAGNQMARLMGDGFLTAYSLEALGLVQRAQAKYTDAVATIESALEMASAQKSGFQMGRYNASLGIVLVEGGADDHGLHMIEGAIAVLGSLGASVELYRARLLKAWALYRLGSKEDALQLLGDLLDAVPATAEAQVFVSEGQHAVPLLNAAHRAFKDREERTQRIKTILGSIKGLKEVAGRLYPLATPVRREIEPALRIFGFGPGRVELEGETIPATAWGAVAARHLLFYMLTHEARTRDQIVADFWPELSSQKAKASFHTTKFRLNRAVGTDAIDYDGQLYMLHPELNLWFDVTEFRSLLDTWRETQDVDVLEAATALYNDDFLSECYMDWCEVEREALRVRCTEALETLAERLLVRRQYRRAVHALRQALKLEPTRETYHQQLMRAYALSGQRSEALVQYERCATELREQLGASPSQYTVELYQRIRDEAPLN